MARDRFQCFVIMPFKPEFRFLYLFLRDHLAARLGITLQRGDDELLTRSLLEKIKWQIARADIVIADITGRSPNVFYEIGFAQGTEKPVVFLSGETEANVPTDIRQFEVIDYSSLDEFRLLDKLENVIVNEFSEQFRDEHRIARDLRDRFAATAGRSCVQAPNNEFFRLMIRDVVQLPSRSNAGPYAEFLLSRVLDASNPAETLREASAWARRQSGLPG